MSDIFTTDVAYFNIFSYKGDQYAETYDDIVKTNNTHNIILEQQHISILYALPIDKIIVTLDHALNEQAGVYTKYSNTNVLWDFGDGTKSTSVSAVHWYKYPGNYKITLTLFTNDLQPVVSEYSKHINVYNYIPANETIYFNKDGKYNYTYGDIIAITPHNLVTNDTLTTYTSKCDEISNASSSTQQLTNDVYLSDAYVDHGTDLLYLNTPKLNFTLHKYNSWQSYNVLKDKGYDVELSVEGCNAPFKTYKEYFSDSYSHLYPCCIITNSEQSIINHLHFDVEGTEVYVRYDDSSNTFVQCDATFTGSVLAGTYDSVELSITDDIPNNNEVSIVSLFDTTGFKSVDNVDSKLHQQWYNMIPFKYTYTNCLSGVYSSASKYINSGKTSIYLTDIFKRIIINTSGIDNDIYDLYDFKFIGRPINFVAQLCMETDQGVWPMKFEPLIEFADDEHINLRFYSDAYTSTDITSSDAIFNLVLQYYTNTDTIPIDTAFYNIIKQDHATYNNKGGFIHCIAYINSYFTNAFFQMICNRNVNSIPNVRHQSIGVTTTFDVINTENTIKLFKQNEGFNLSQVYENVAQQPILRDSPTLFTDLIGSIVGNGDSYNDLGSRIYEKISNYVMNTQDIDTCNIEHLYDMYNKFNEYIADVNYAWPEELQRLVDLLSVKFNKLVGEYNQFDSDFDKNGYTNNPDYGKNLGEQIDYNSGRIYTNETIVAYEKFSGKYIKLSCDIPIRYIEQQNLQTTDVAGVSSYNIRGFTDTERDIQHITGMHLEYNGNAIPSEPLNMSPTESITLSAVFEYLKIADTELRYKWGWNLVLPEGEDFNIEDYYIFYRFVPNTTQEIIGSIIDWTKSKNPKSDITRDGFVGSSALLKWDEIKRKYIMQIIIKHIFKEIHQYMEINASATEIKPGEVSKLTAIIHNGITP